MSDQQMPTPADVAALHPHREYTQADVDRIVKDRLVDHAAQYADYEDVRAAAEEANQIQSRIGELEQQLAGARLSALRSDVAGRYGVTAEDRDLFLTGADEATLEAQASRLVAMDHERLSNGNRAPREGHYPGKPGREKNAEMREFTAALFGDDPDL